MLILQVVLPFSKKSNKNFCKYAGVPLTINAFTFSLKSSLSTPAVKVFKVLCYLKCLKNTKYVRTVLNHF